MNRGNFRLKDVNIGDFVFFSIRKINNLQRYWTVVGIEKDGKIKVHLDGHDYIDEILINVGDIDFLLPAAVESIA